MSASYKRNLTSMIDQVYQRLFDFISDLRPSIQTELKAITREIELGQWNVDASCGTALKQIEGNLDFNLTLLSTMKQHHADGSMQTHAYLIYLIDIMRSLYGHANYWYTLINGIVFESTIQVYTEKFLNEVSQLTGYNKLDLLCDIIEPLTEFKYYEYVPEDVLSNAHSELKVVKTNLQRKKRSDLAHKLSIFISDYSRLKYWNLEYKRVSNDSLGPTLRSVKKEILEVINNYDPCEAICWESAPWDYLPSLSERTIPKVLKKNYGLDNK